MCGRFIQCTSGERLAERFHLSVTPNIAPRYNVAPRPLVGIVRVTEGGDRQ